MESVLLFLPICYILGSIPTAVWTSTLVYGMDIRTQGSGNAGATNTFRVLGKKAGIFVLLFDIFKGFAGVSLVSFLPVNPEFDPFSTRILFGLVTVLGHIYPIFAGFKGGKGIATMLGMLVALHYPSALVCVLAFLVVFMVSHYVSVGSMSAALVFGLLATMDFCGPLSTSALLLVWALVALVFFTHRSNIKKLQTGSENKMYFVKPKKS